MRKYFDMVRGLVGFLTDNTLKTYPKKFGPSTIINFI